MAGGNEWLEVRATRTGLLDVGEARPGGEPAYDGVLSVVADSSVDAKTRRLPTLFLGPSPVYVHRDIDRVVDRMKQTIAILQRAYTESIFLATPMKIGERVGLYARDHNARSAYRRRLERMGAELSPSSFMTMTSEGEFKTDDFEPFRPDFVVSESVDEPDTGAHPVSPGLLVMQIATLRLGRMDAPGLGVLARGLAGAEGIGAERPEDLFERLSG